MPRIVFYDIEASSLSPESYPVEVGWAEVLPDGSVRGEAMLVHRAPGWLDWSMEAQSIHGITRGQLKTHGRPIEEVITALDAVFGTGVVFSDHPSSEVVWTDCLYRVAGRKRRWRVGDALPLLSATAATKEDSAWLQVRLQEQRLHRADADARVFAEAYAELRRRRRMRERSEA
jgi:hypothetical protein